MVFEEASNSLKAVNDVLLVLQQAEKMQGRR
jgi:hypothetical protein